jgi:hypothetical protein
VNGQFVGQLVFFALERPFAVKIYPPYGIDRRVPYPFLLRTSAADPHFIYISDPSTDMTHNTVN